MDAALPGRPATEEAGFQTRRTASSSVGRRRLPGYVIGSVTRGVGALVTGLAALFAALHYWPPHG